MRIEVTEIGVIETINENDNLHSVNGKPARIRPSGTLMWYDDGRLTKIIWADGVEEEFEKGQEDY